MWNFWKKNKKRKKSESKIENNKEYNNLELNLEYEQNEKNIKTQKENISVKPQIATTSQKKDNSPKKNLVDETIDLGLEKEKGVKLITNVKTKRLTKKSKKNKNTILFLIFGFFTILFVISGIKILLIELTHSSHGQDLTKYSLDNIVRDKTIPAERGTIFDASEKPLATNLKLYTMIAHLNKKDTSGFGYVKNPDTAVQKIVKILDYENNLKAQSLISKQLHASGGKNPVNQVEFGVYAKNITISQKSKLEKAKIGGLEFTERQERYYPYGEFASYILGYAFNGENNKIIGEMGVEKRNDNYLKGVNGKYTVQQDNNGVENENTKEIEKEASDGSNIDLTVDSSIQSYVHDSMKNALSGHSYDRASTIVMNKDGAILAAESYPNFDPNKRNMKDYTDPFFDRCYEPGSPMKTFMVAAAIEDGKWDSSNTYTSGKRTNDRWGKSNYIADWLYNEEKSSWGTITWSQGYYVSSNVAMTHVLDSVGYSRWQNYASNKFEYGKSINTTTLSTNSCKYSPKYDFEIATTSFGQGMTANMAQILRGYSVFANEGKMVTPYLIKDIKDPQTGKVIYKGKEDLPVEWRYANGKLKKGVTIDEQSGQAYKKVLKESTVKQVNKLMNGVMYYKAGGMLAGTGIDYGKATKHKIIGKTGTSETVVDGSYKNNKNIYSAVILAPADNPQIIVYTTLENPSESYPNPYIEKYLSSTVDNTLNYLDKENAGLNTEESSFSLTKTPNLINKPENEIAEIERINKLKIIKLGKGKPIKQYPQEGSQITRGTHILIIGNQVSTKELEKLSLTDFINYALVYNIEYEIKGKGNKIKKIEIVENKYKVVV